MRLERYVSEMFNKDSKIRIKVTQDEAKNFGVKFTADDQPFVVKATKCIGDKWEVGFGLEQNFELWPDHPKCFKVKIKKTGDIMKGSTDVFGAVFTGMRRFIKKKKPEEFYFRTDDPKRKSLYKRFVKKFKAEIKKYDFSVTIEDSKDGTTHFKFTKAKPSVVSEKGEVGKDGKIKKAKKEDKALKEYRCVAPTDKVDVVVSAKSEKDAKKRLVGFIVKARKLDKTGFAKVMAELSSDPKSYTIKLVTGKKQTGRKTVKKTRRKESQGSLVSLSLAD